MLHLLGMDAPVNANEKTAVNGAGGVSEPEPGAEDVAAARLAGLVSPEAVDRMLAGAELAGVGTEARGNGTGSLAGGAFHGQSGLADQKDRTPRDRS